MVPALLGFAAAATLLILAPGPDTMLVMRNALRGGRRVGVCTAAGTLTGLVSWAVAAALGLSSLLAASRVGYDLLRVVGALYLIWLGVTTLWRRHPTGVDGSGPAPEPGRPAAAAPRLGRGYINGVISNVCNPKIGVFFVAFLPGFIPSGVSVGEFSFLLGLWFAVETGIWLAAIVWMVVRGVGWLHRPGVQRKLERITGLVLIGFGVRLATETR
ncbi:MAG: LysE family translocator [Actinomycetes bacterium]